MERRDPEQPDPARPSREDVRETLIERQIREAMADGRFDHLPHQGRRLPLEDDSLAGDRAMAFRVLRNAGAAPPWIVADKEVRTLLEARDRLFARAARSSLATRSRLRVELEAIVHDANRAIARLNAEAPTDRQHRLPIDLRAELERLDAAFER